MATQPETVDFILEKLGRSARFSARAMFGEYALYADDKVVGLVCNDLLYVKVLPASQDLETICDKDTPYPGAKACYLVEEAQLTRLENLPAILFRVAASLPAKKKKASAKSGKKLS